MTGIGKLKSISEWRQWVELRLSWTEKTGLKPISTSASAVLALRQPVFHYSGRSLMKYRWSSLAMAAAIALVIFPVVAQSEQSAAALGKTVGATSLSEIVGSAVGPFDAYCDGYGNPGANGTGYVSVLTLHVGKVPKSSKLTGQNGKGLDGTVAFDKAESSEAYIGQINLVVASSFSGLNGVIWGYDIAKADELIRSPLASLFTLQRGRTETPVYSMEPLLDAGKRLFGTREEKRFPMLPGAHIVAAHKDIIVVGPTTAWCGMALGIASDRQHYANLFMELCGELKLQSAGKRKYFSQVCISLPRAWRWSAKTRAWVIKKYSWVSDMSSSLQAMLAPL
jgi:histidine decarboxylase